MKELDLSDVWTPESGDRDCSRLNLMKQYQESLEALYMVDLFQHPDGPYDSGLKTLEMYTTKQSKLTFPALENVAVSLVDKLDDQQEGMLFTEGGPFPQLKNIYMHIHPYRIHRTAANHSLLSPFSRFSSVQPGAWSHSRWNQMAEQFRLQQRGVRVYLRWPLLEVQADVQLNPHVFFPGGEWHKLPVGAHLSRSLPAPTPPSAPMINDPEFVPMDTSPFSVAAASLPQRLSCPATVFHHKETSTTPFTSAHLPGAVWPLDAVWKVLGTKGEGIRVAVLDSGFAAHPLFSQQVERMSSTVPFHHACMDPCGHGTHVAAILARVAPAAKLQLIQAFSGVGQSGTPEWLTAGFQEALNANVDIISLSGGSAFNDPALYAVVHEALARGKIIVCAASNEGSKESFGIRYPAAYGGVLCVGSHDQHGNRSSFSPTGRELDLLAPGELIQSASPDMSEVTMSGTSMACPFVAGLVALLLASDRLPNTGPPQLVNISQVRTVLRELTTKRGDHTQESGHGAINLGLLVKYGREHLYRILQ